MQSIKKIYNKDKNNKLSVVKKFLSVAVVISLIFNGMNVISFAYNSFYWECNPNTQEEDLLYNNNYWVGGAESELLITLRRFEENNPKQRGKYEIHNLISKEALRRFRDFLMTNGNRVVGYTLFWNDDTFGWVPSIIMTKEDHKKVPSYINKDEQTIKEYTFAQTIIDKQTDDLIEHRDFLSLLNMEIDYIWNRFPGEYNNAIQYVENYIYNFGFQKVYGYVEFRAPYEFINKFHYAYWSE